MTLGNILLLVILVAIGYRFWRLRDFSEMARRYIESYCSQHNLQLLSVARSKTRIAMNRGKLDWKLTFQFEFSGTGEDRYIGSVEMLGNKVLSTYTPPHRIG